MTTWVPVTALLVVLKMFSVIAEPPAAASALESAAVEMTPATPATPEKVVAVATAASGTIEMTVVNPVIAVSAAGAPAA